MFAPAGTPRPIVERLNAEVNQLLQLPEVRERYAAQNLETFPPASPERFAQFIRAELAKSAKVAHEAKIEAPQ